MMNPNQDQGLETRLPDATMPIVKQIDYATVAKCSGNFADVYNALNAMGIE